MRATTVQIQQRGKLLLPSKLRTKYRLDDGDRVTVLDLNGSILLSPKAPVVPRLAADIERMRRAADLDLKDLLVYRGSRRSRRGPSRKAR
jgi:bifunctional DNA-binding transcriptional regulator/antitoxin component of YhaV-PrlF toxin-antitoxin module